MQEKKNIRLLVIFGLLCVLAAVLYLGQRDEGQPEVNPQIFKVEDISKIDKVEMQSSGHTVTLHYDGAHWKVDDRYQADRQRITILFATLEKAVPKRPVASARRDSISNRIKDQGVTVRLYEGGTLKKEFGVTGNSQKTESYFSLSGESKPYIMMIPGYRVYVSQIFELDENEWRDKRIFGFRWENFRSLTGVFPTEPKAGFDIEKKDRVYSVKGEPRADTTRIFNFLDDVSLLVADKILPSTPSGVDSLTRIRPVFTLEIRDIADRTYALRLYQPAAGEALVPGLIDDQTIVMFEPRRLFKIVKKRSYFTDIPR